MPYSLWWASTVDSYRQSRRLADRLQEAGLDPLEADVNPADRFLIERFIAGGAEILGVPVDRGGYLRLDNPSIRSAQYQPKLKVVSFDIETAMSGVQLFSIAVHGVFGDEQARKVFMLGEGAEQDYVQGCASQESGAAGVPGLACRPTTRMY